LFSKGDIVTFYSCAVSWSASGIEGRMQVWGIQKLQWSRFFLSGQRQTSSLDFCVIS